MAATFSPLIDAVAALERKDLTGAAAATPDEVFQDNLADEALNAALAELPEGAPGELGDEIAALLGREDGRLRDATKPGGAE